MTWITRRLTYANVMATIAVFVALGGSGYAAIKLPKNSVQSKQIKNGQVKGADIAANAVTSAKVKNGALLAADFKAGQLPAGAKGDTGAQGPQGPSGVAALTVVTATANGNQAASVDCPAGLIATGGGGNATSLSENAPVITNGKPKGWRVNGANGSKAVWALCVPDNS
jgi:hypothetical protein